MAGDEDHHLLGLKRTHFFEKVEPVTVRQSLVEKDKLKSPSGMLAGLLQRPAATQFDAVAAQQTF